MFNFIGILLLSKVAIMVQIECLFTHFFCRNFGCFESLVKSLSSEVSKLNVWHLSRSSSFRLEITFSDSVPTWEPDIHDLWSGEVGGVWGSEGEGLREIWRCLMRGEWGVHPGDDRDKGDKGREEMTWNGNTSIKITISTHVYTCNFRSLSSPPLPFSHLCSPSILSSLILFLLLFHPCTSLVPFPFSTLVVTQL